MQFNRNVVAALVVSVSAVVGGAYYVIQSVGQGSNLPKVGPITPGAPIPPGHPTQVPGGALTGEAGKMGMNAQNKFAHFRVGNKNVKSIYVEKDTAWVGTSGGVVRYDSKTDNYKLYDNTNGLLSNGIFYVGRIQGKLTVGTYGGGMSVLNETDGTWKHYNIPQGLGDAFVYDVIEAKNGDVWIATWSGANRIRGGKLDDRSQWDLYTVENTKGGLPNDWVYGLAEGKDGVIWMATEGGMARFVEGKWENWNHKKGGIGTPYEKVRSAIEFKNDPGKASVHHAKQKQEMGLEGVDVAYNPNYIVALEVTRDGKVYAGTWGGGMTVWDGQGWTNYSSLEGLPGNHVFMLHEDRKGNLWVGTNKGMALFKDGKIVRTYSTADGLFDNNVFSMATTEDGSQWIGSYGGVAFIKAGN